MQHAFWARCGLGMAWLMALAMNLTGWIIPFGWPDFGVFLYQQVFPPFVPHLNALRHHAQTDAAHRVLGGLLLLTGALQFEPAFRQRWPRLHRHVGRFYVLLGLCTVVSAVCLGWRVPFASFPESAITTAASLAYGAMLIRAWMLACGRHIMAHREWVLRAHALVCFIATMRVLTGVFYHAGASASGQEIFLTSGVFGIAINLTLVEMWIQTSRAQHHAPQPAG